MSVCCLLCESTTKVQIPKLCSNSACHSKVRGPAADKQFENWIVASSGLLLQVRFIEKST